MIDSLPTKPEATLWDPAEYLDSEEEIAAYLEAALVNGDPSLISVVHNDIERARTRLIG